MTAPCAGKLHIFYPPEGYGYAQAKAICAGCPQKQECLEAGLYEREGCWGGTSPKDRRRLLAGRDRLPPINHGTEGGARTHRRRGELPCWACARAASLAQRLRYHAA